MFISITIPISPVYYSSSHVLPPYIFFFSLFYSIDFHCFSLYILHIDVLMYGVALRPPTTRRDVRHEST
ncbi:uncharacterized protein BDW47DRAFT_8555 [Aspergillus candidus]|uniref:Uncharacterized protein n=1 Tax=Aspergillus candidus TaxID=41067 RepID=A0A2I2FGX2_ASPCN|nr:hypothetical protein BDW47DRAFT_8555 [Aspergillus candidus]PLB39850.1 hypothetical protein BDW47DRAFT_8555 [Aspergillus candidus]